MNEKVIRTFNAWLKLSSTEKQQLAEAIEDYEGEGLVKRGSIQESIAHTTRMDLGPLSGTCPYCGK